jgi:hypothetical protein
MNKLRVFAGALGVLAALALPLSGAAGPFDAVCTFT